MSTERTYFMAENSKTVGNIVVWHGPHCKKTCIPLENKITEIWLLFFFSGSKNNIKVYQNMYKEYIFYLQICSFVLNYEKKGTLNMEKTHNIFHVINNKISNWLVRWPRNTKTISSRQWMTDYLRLWLKPDFF